jgi:hypothetical protein
VLITLKHDGRAQLSNVGYVLEPDQRVLRGLRHAPGQAGLLELADALPPVVDLAGCPLHELDERFGGVDVAARAEQFDLGLGDGELTPLFGFGFGVAASSHTDSGWGSGRSSKAWSGRPSHCASRADAPKRVQTRRSVHLSGRDPPPIQASPLPERLGHYKRPLPSQND